VFELIEMLSIDIHYQSYTDKLTLHGWDFGVLLGHFWSQNDVITMVEADSHLKVIQ
jgi:hypothetical protein